MSATPTATRQPLRNEQPRRFLARIHALAFRAQLGPTRELSWREFSPRH